MTRVWCINLGFKTSMAFLRIRLFLFICQVTLHKHPHDIQYGNNATVLHKSTFMHASSTKFRENIYIYINILNIFQLLWIYRD